MQYNCSEKRRTQPRPFRNCIPSFDKYHDILTSRTRRGNPAEQTAALPAQPMLQPPVDRQAQKKTVFTRSNTFKFAQTCSNTLKYAQTGSKNRLKKHAQTRSNLLKQAQIGPNRPKQAQTGSNTLKHAQTRSNTLKHAQTRSNTLKHAQTGSSQCRNRPLTARPEISSFGTTKHALTRSLNTH